jgi:hypothetical protein
MFRFAPSSPTSLIARNQTTQRPQTRSQRPRGRLTEIRLAASARSSRTPQLASSRSRSRGRVRWWRAFSSKRLRKTKTKSRLGCVRLSSIAPSSTIQGSRSGRRASGQRSISCSVGGWRFASGRRRTSVMARLKRIRVDLDHKRQLPAATDCRGSRSPPTINVGGRAERQRPSAGSETNGCRR